jgi:subtilase family serine protease
VAAIGFAAPGAASAKRTAIRGSSPPAAAQSPRAGAVPGGTSIDFEVALKLPDQKAAADFARAVSTPGSAQYGKYLTAAQWEARFSPSAADVARVTTFLKQNNFTVHGASADRMTLSASGTAAQVEHAFSTSLSYHRVHGLRLRLADKNLSIPSGLAGTVLGVIGVSQTVAHPDSTTGDPAPAATASPTYAQPAGFRVAPPCGDYYNQKLDTTLTPYGNGFPATPPWAVCGYKPPQFRSAYNLSGGNDGSGVTVAVVDAFASPTIFDDAHKYAGLNDPANPLSSAQFSQQNSSVFTDGDLCGASGWFGEETLDVEAVHATAPGANILFSGAKNCTTSALNDAVRKIVDGHSADVITNSYGDNAGDALDTAEDRAVTDSILQMAAGTGISVLFSSGDNGDEFTTVGRPTADYPASSPWATAVGGTSLQIGSNGKRIAEYGWSTARGLRGVAARDLAADRPRARRRLRRRHQHRLPAAGLPARRRPELALGAGLLDADASGAGHLDGRRSGDGDPRRRDPDVPRRRPLRPVPDRRDERVLAAVCRGGGARGPDGRSSDRFPQSVAVFALRPVEVDLRRDSRGQAGSVAGRLRQQHHPG